MAGNQLHAGVASWYYRQSHGAVEVEVKGICLQAQALLVGNCLLRNTLRLGGRFSLQSPNSLPPGTLVL